MKEKSYYNIKELTENFREDAREELSTGDVLRWQVKAQLAIVQQLTIISATLGELLEAVHRSEKTTSKQWPPATP